VDVSDIGVVVMQGRRPGKWGFEPLLKALHHGSGQFVHIEIALHILPFRIGAEFQPVKVCAFGCVIDKLVRLVFAQIARRAKQCTAEAFLVPARSGLNVGNVGFCSLTLIAPPFDIVGFDDRHVALRFLPLPLPRLLALLLVQNPTLDFLDEFLKFGRSADELFLGLLERVIKDVV
jgi:hypothetical protein